MARKRGTRKTKTTTGSGNSAALIVILALLIVAGILYYIAWKRQQDQPPPTAWQPPAATVPGTSLADLYAYGGLPRPAPGAGAEVAFTTLKNQAFYVGYSESRRNPLWAAYRVPDTDQPFNLPRPSSFTIDERTQARVKTSDFTGSGYQRGHLAPNSAIARAFGREAQLETFMLSNICPQTPALNEHVWERLEVLERSYADRLEEVWVITGPIFGDLNGGVTPKLASGVAVPTSFFKIVVDEEGRKGGPPRMFAVIMPQDVKGSELPQEFLTSVDVIESQTRLDFFWAMDASTQEQMEAKVYRMW